MNIFNFFRKKSKESRVEKSKMIASILTGVPVQTRGHGGELTGAGLQQRGWCQQILRDMGKKKSMMVEIMGGKQKMTREYVEEHLRNI